MSVMVVTGTGTGVGKTVTTAALATAALRAERTVAVLKPAQTGVGPAEPRDVTEVVRLAGPEVTAREMARFPEPLAPVTAAPQGRAAVSRCGGGSSRGDGAGRAARPGPGRGAGGLLVRFGADGSTLVDAARLLDAPVLVVAAAGLGTLNATALTAEALRNRGLSCRGVLIGAWPREPDLACGCNLTDLPEAADAALVGVLPEGAAAAKPSDFRAMAPGWLAPRLGDTWSPVDPATVHAPAG